VPDLKEQAGGPIANPGEMAFTHELAVDMLNSIPGYQAEFKKVFSKQKIDIDQVTDAIAAFEETLVTPNSRFDKWLKGDQGHHQDRTGRLQAVQGQRLRGLPQRSGRGRQFLPEDGLVEAYKTSNPAEGRSAVTGKDADRFNFKVPTLRNVELTYPYFHDGAPTPWARPWTPWAACSWARSSPRKRTPRSWPS
jgi:cytochrome c peroxidase